MIRFVAAAAVGIAAVAAYPAAADPVVTGVRFATAEVRVAGADGHHWRLSLLATASGAAHTETPTSGDGQELAVSALRCSTVGCAAAGSWRIALRDDEITVERDYSSASLRTTLFGQPLHADLKPTGPETGTVQVSIGVPDGPGDPFATAGRVVHAAGSVRIGSVTCSARDALIGEEVRVEEELPAPGRTSDAPRGLFGGSGPRCL